MHIQLASELENSIQALVQSGRFASVDEAMAAATQLLLADLAQNPPTNSPELTRDPGLGSIGAMRDDADLLDQVVEHALRMRQEQPWRLNPVE